MLRIQSNGGVLRAALLGAAFVILFTTSVPATAQSSCANPVKTLDYDHYHENRNVTFPQVTVASGEVIEVKITNTCQAAFDYAYVGIGPTPQDNDKERGAAGACDVAGSSISVCIQHDDQFVSYLVKIALKPGQSPKAELDGEEHDLNSVTLVVPVVHNPWKLDFSTGFTVSQLTDPVYAGDKQMEGSMEVTKVVRDRQAEDDRNLGIATFAHVTHESWGSPNVGYFGPSLGLGIDQRNQASYFLGASWLWGNRGALTAGYQWGSVDRLPAGVSVGDTVDDVNTLSDLPTRTDGAFFLSFSYSFLGGRDQFEKKVANVGTPSGPKAAVMKEENGDAGDKATSGGASPPLPRRIQELKVKRSDDKILLSWTAAAGSGVTYQLFHGTSCDSLVEIIPKQIESPYFEEPDPAVTYYYRVRAVIDGVHGDLSDCVEAPTP